MKIKERLKELRIKNNITQKQLANAVSITEIAVSRYELGVRTPTLEIAAALADYFNVSLDYLVGRSDNPARL